MKQTIIDLGCGTGNELKKYYKKYNIIGVDIDPENIAICKKIMPEGKWVVADLNVILSGMSRSGAEANEVEGSRCISEKTGSFGFTPLRLPSVAQGRFAQDDIKLVICTEVLEHVDNWQTVIKNFSHLPAGTKIYLTVPHESNEKKLLKLKPNYWQEIRHKHFFTGEEIKKELEKNGWHDIKIKRTNAALYFELKSLFKKKAPCIRGTYYENILPLPIKIFWQLFRPNLFQTKLKYFFPLWMVTLPISLVLNRLWGGTVEVRTKKTR